MQDSYRVQVTKDYLTFASAHFAVFSENEREALHGHNYRLGVAVEGTLDRFGFVLDFSVLKKMARRFVDAIDHRILLARDNQQLRYEEDGDHWRISWEGKLAYVLPKSEVIMLPIANTTVEHIAPYFADQFQAELAAKGFTNLTLLEIEVEETSRQAAVYRRPLLSD